jgi:hypothetical protein
MLEGAARSVLFSLSSVDFAVEVVALSSSFHVSLEGDGIPCNQPIPDLTFGIVPILPTT